MPLSAGARHLSKPISLLPILLVHTPNFSIFMFPTQRFSSAMSIPFKAPRTVLVLPEFLNACISNTVSSSLDLSSKIAKFSTLISDPVSFASAGGVVGSMGTFEVAVYFLPRSKLLYECQPILYDQTGNRLIWGSGRLFGIVYGNEDGKMVRGNLASRFNQSALTSKKVCPKGNLRS
ncbi:hypothetical protein KCU78_g76, partial [Aureobasidium melanogenum]